MNDIENEREKNSTRSNQWNEWFPSITSKFSIWLTLYTLIGSMVYKLQSRWLLLFNINAFLFHRTNLYLRSHRILYFVLHTLMLSELINFHLGCCTNQGACFMLYTFWEFFASKKRELRGKGTEYYKHTNKAHKKLKCHKIIDWNHIFCYGFLLVHSLFRCISKKWRQIIANEKINVVVYFPMENSGS